MYYCVGPAGELLRQVLSKPELLYLCNMSGLCAGLQAKYTRREVYVKVWSTRCLLYVVSASYSTSDNSSGASMLQQQVQ